MKNYIAIVCALGFAVGCGGTGSASNAPAPREVWGFTAFWDTASVSSVARNGAALSAVREQYERLLFSPPMHGTNDVAVQLANLLAAVLPGAQASSS